MRTMPRGARGVSGLGFDADREHGFPHFVVPAIVALGVFFLTTPVRADSTPATTQVGQASWYGGEFARRRTASGDTFDPEDLTGAHRTLPLGSRVRVTNLHN